MIDAAKYKDLEPGHRLVLGPGPSPVSERVLRSMAATTIGHLDPYYLKVMSEIQELLRYAYNTENEMTISLSGTGSSGMDACLLNLVEPGDKVMICVNGFFSARMIDIAERAGGQVALYESEWGRSLDMDAVRAKAKEVKPDLLCMVMAETSTGALNDVAAGGQIAKEVGAMFLTDCVTSLGGLPIDVDANGIDAAYSCSQKCLGAPSGLSPVTFSPRAMDKVRNRKTKPNSWYLDMNLLADYWAEGHKYHHTASSNMNYALREALRMVAEEGLEARFARHQINHLALVAGVEAMGLEMQTPEGERLPMLNVVKIPEGVDDLKVRQILMKDFGMEIGAGLGQFGGKVWRIGLMGYGSTKANVIAVLSTLQTVLAGLGAPVKPGALEAAAAVYK